MNTTEPIFKTSYLEEWSHCEFCKKELFHIVIKKDKKMVDNITSCSKCRKFIRKIHNSKFKFDESMDDFRYHLFCLEK